jgi:hypothetical protein
MADTRTLKLALLADVAQFGRGLAKAEDHTKSLNSKISGFSKKMAASFAVVTAAAGAMAIKFGVDAVNAAVEDELSQKKLAKALQNTTKATDKQIASTETWITKQQFAYGVSDTKLRPALANLTRATGNLKTAQDLTNLSLDISAGTGKDLESVSIALSKAYGGNLGALKKLGVPLDDSIIKSKDFSKATDELQKLFGGSAAANTETYAGKLAILKQRFGELQEGFGAKFIGVLSRVAEVAIDVAKGFSGEQSGSVLVGIRATHDEISKKSGGYTLGEALREVANAMGNMVDAVAGGQGASAATNLESIASAMSSLAHGINNVADAYGKLSRFVKSSGYQKGLDFIFGTDTGGTRSSFLFDTGGALKRLTSNGGRATGGPVTSGSYLVGERGPELLTLGAGSRGNVTPNSRMGGNTFILNGIVDAESARRSIERLLQTQSRISGPINLAGAMP